MTEHNGGVVQLLQRVTNPCHIAMATDSSSGYEMALHIAGPCQLRPITITHMPNSSLQQSRGTKPGFSHIPRWLAKK